MTKEDPTGGIVLGQRGGLLDTYPILSGQATGQNHNKTPAHKDGVLALGQGLRGKGSSGGRNLTRARGRQLCATSQSERRDCVRALFYKRRNSRGLAVDRLSGGSGRGGEAETENRPSGQLKFGSTTAYQTPP